MTVLWVVAPCNLVEVSEDLTASIIRVIKMETVRTSEMAFNFHEAIGRKIPEHSHLNSRRRENLKFHQHDTGWLSACIFYMRATLCIIFASPFYVNCYNFNFKLHSFNFGAVDFGDDQW